MGLLKYFAPWDMFWFQGIETFLDKNCLICLAKILKSI